MADKNDNQKIYDRFNDDVQYMIIYSKAASINANVESIHPESFIVGLLTMGINDVSKSLVRHDIDLEKSLKIFKDRLKNHRTKNQVTTSQQYNNIKPTKVSMAVCKWACALGDELDTRI